MTALSFHTAYCRINKQQLEHPEASATDASEEHLGGKHHGNKIYYGKGRNPGDSLGLSAIFCLDLLILLFQREVCAFLCIRRQLRLAELLFNHDKAVFL